MSAFWMPKNKNPLLAPGNKTAAAAAAHRQIDSSKKIRDSVRNSPETQAAKAAGVKQMEDLLADPPKPKKVYVRLGWPFIYSE